jgi:predicted glutamine amidotransferase
MCILIHHPANVSFSDELLNDFYDHNSDGFGAMYSEGGKLVVVKTLGNPQEINALYKDALKGRECIIHYRMKTHGDIDLENCHPYKVTDDIWMAHNGILSMGNPIDKTKSDTWHFIKFMLRPALEANPMLIFDPDYQDYLENMIGGSNKFAFMHSSGESVVINYDAGVEHEGAWLSNTYAWSAHKHGHGVKYKTNKYYSGSWGINDDYGYNIKGSTKHSSKTLASGAAFGDYDDEYAEFEDYALYDCDVSSFGKKLNIRKITKAAYNCHKRGTKVLYDWVLMAPNKAAYLLEQAFGEKHEGEMWDMVNAYPEDAVEWIQDLFEAGNYNDATVAAM